MRAAVRHAETRAMARMRSQCELLERYCHSTCVVGRELLTFGGRLTSGVASDALISVNADSFQCRTVETGGTPPAPRYSHAAVAVGVAEGLEGARSMLVHGGQDGEHLFSDLRLLNTGSLCWIQIAPPPPPQSLPPASAPAASRAEAAAEAARLAAAPSLLTRYAHTMCALLPPVKRKAHRRSTAPASAEPQGLLLGSLPLPASPRCHLMRPDLTRPS